MREHERAFLERLWGLQAEAGLSGSALANDLGVHPSAISRLRTGIAATGKEGLSLRFVTAAVARFPELRCLLPAELRISTDTVPISTEAETMAS